MTGPSSRPRIAAKARLKWDRHGSKHMLLFPERGLVLNASAASILEKCDGVRTVAEIATEIAEATKEEPARIVAEVVAFLEALRKKALVEI